MTDGPDLRPLGTGGETAPPLDSTPLVQPDSGIIGGGPAAAVEPSRLLPAAPSYADPAKARAVRNQLDPVGHWDAVVACATMPDGTLQVDGAVHVFLNSAVLVRQLGGPAHAGLDIRESTPSQPAQRWPQPKLCWLLVVWFGAHPTVPARPDSRPDGRYAECDRHAG